MSIIFDDYGLTDIQPPCVAQSFINHNAVLYKVFIIGDQQFIVERPSIKNLLPRGKVLVKVKCSLFLQLFIMGL